MNKRIINSIKQILIYAIWVIVCMLSTYLYMLIILGPEPETSKGFLKIFNLIYDAVMFYVGLRVAAIISVLFILFDVFYLKERLKNNSKKTIFRFLIIVFITSVVGITHYIFEKIIDVI